MTPLPQVQEANAGCSACPLRAGCDQVVVGRGPATARLMVVGEHPGPEENVAGEPFQSRDGLALKKLLYQAGLTAADVYLTYLVKCAPGRAGVGAAAASCKRWLWREMQSLSPAVVVTLGRAPTGLLLGLKTSFRLADHLGVFAPVGYLPGAAVAPWHPAARLGQQGKAGDRATVEFFLKAKERL